MQLLYKYFLFLFLLIVLCMSQWYVPLLQRQIPALEAPDLGGSFEAAPGARLSARNWMSGYYQKASEQHLKQESAIAPFFVRLRNEWIYQLFGEVPSALVAKGQDGFFYSTTYCDAFIGKDEIPQTRLEQLSNQLQFIQQALEAKGKSLLVILPPSKPRVLPEHLPAFYQKNGSKSSNYDRFRFLLFDKKVPTQDFSFFFSQKAPYPIYPQYGLHWSYYGAAWAADSIRHQIGQLLSVQLPEMQWRDSIALSTDLRSTDRELLYGANLWKDPEVRPMPYPTIRYEQIDSIHTPPKVLAVGDSYYKLLYDYGIPQGLFHPASRFWYYYNTSIPAGEVAPRAENIEEVINRFDIILLPHAEINIEKMGFGFLDALEQALKQEW